LIHSVAVRPDNSELAEARRHGITVLTYPQALGRFLAGTGASGFVTEAVRASSSHNVWVFASYQRSAPYPLGIFRWDGAAWHSVPVPDPVGIGYSVVFSASDVWTVGQGDCTSTAGGLLNCKSQLWHWNGGTWHSYRVGTFVTGLAGTSPGNVWAVGMNGMTTQQGEVQGNVAAYRWNGARWTWVSMPHPRINGDPGIGISSATDVWFGSLITLPHSGGQDVSFAMHWTGHRWQEFTAPRGLVSNGAVVADGHGGAWVGPMARWTGRSWVEVTASVPSGVGWEIADISRIPGTSSYWGAGTLINSNGSFRPVAFVYGALPR
jgi:hypothetical protein